MSAYRYCLHHWPAFDSCSNVSPMASSLHVSSSMTIIWPNPPSLILLRNPHRHSKGSILHNDLHIRCNCRENGALTSIVCSLTSSPHLNYRALQAQLTPTDQQRSYSRVHLTHLFLPQNSRPCSTKACPISSSSPCPRIFKVVLGWRQHTTSLLLLFPLLASLSPILFSVHLHQFQISPPPLLSVTAFLPHRPILCHRPLYPLQPHLRPPAPQSRHQRNPSQPLCPYGTPPRQSRSNHRPHPTPALRSSPSWHAATASRDSPPKQSSRVFLASQLPCHKRPRRTSCLCPTRTPTPQPFF